MLAHRERAERALGRPLPAGSLVHHADGTKSIQSPLVICPDHAYHAFLHERMRIKAAGGDPNTQRVCTRCGQVKDRARFSPKLTNRWCHDCQAIYANDRYHARKAATL
jgi:hypothetical protein